MGRKFALFAATLATILVLPASVLAASTPVTQSVVQGYGSDTSLQNGMIVRLKSGDTTKVEPLAQSDTGKMLGVVVPFSQATVTLGNTGNSDQVFVASSGRFDVLVSNENGPIKSGDFITISSLAGIGEEADDVQPMVLGKAAAGFDGIGNVVGSAKLKNSAGKEVSVSLGRIPIEIGITHNPLQRTDTDTLPSFLRQASIAISGEQSVSAIRTYISLAVLLITAVIAGIMLYAGIRSGVTAVGRNPLAKKSILRDIIQVIVSSIIVLIIGMFVVYLILKL